MSVLFPVVYEYLVSSGFMKTAKKLLAEAGKDKPIACKEELEVVLKTCNDLEEKRKVEQTQSNDSQKKKSKKKDVEVPVKEEVIEPEVKETKTKKSKKVETEESNVEVVEKVKEKSSKRKNAEVVEEVPVVAPVEKSSKRKKAEISVTHDNETKEVEECAEAEPVAKKAKSTPQKNQPFQRIDPTKVEIDERLVDNSYFGKIGSTDYGGKAARDLIVVKGKNFRHEKTKKKRSTYRGGDIDFGVNSIKFDD